MKITALLAPLLALAAAAASGPYPDVSRARADIDAALHEASKSGKRVLAVLESDGRVVFAQKSGEFESMRKVDPRAVDDFLRKWRR